MPGRQLAAHEAGLGRSGDLGEEGGEEGEGLQLGGARLVRGRGGGRGRGRSGRVKG